MKISRTMLKDHLRPITVNYFADHDMHPSDSADYIPYVKGVKDSVEKAGDMASFKMGLEYILTHPEIDSTDLNGGTYAFNDDKMRNLLEIVCETMWPGEKLPENPAKVELVAMSEEEWLKMRNS